MYEGLGFRTQQFGILCLCLRGGDIVWAVEGANTMVRVVQAMQHYRAATSSSAADRNDKAKESHITELNFPWLRHRSLSVTGIERGRQNI